MKKLNVNIQRALENDLIDILKLQKVAYLSEAEIYHDYAIPPFTQTLSGVLDDFKSQIILKATLNGKIIGSVRGLLTDDSCYIGRLMVYPEFQHNGLGTRLMQAIQGQFKQVKKYTLIAGALSARNIRLYEKLGFKTVKKEKVNDKVTVLYMEKPNTL